MPRFDDEHRVLHAKIVYYGPPLSGKTTNLIQMHRMVDPRQCTRLFSLNTKEDRTLFFDLMPLEVGRILDRQLRLQVYTVPGQVHYKCTRRMVLEGADACVFVADSRPDAMGGNLAALEDLWDNLAMTGRDPEDLPLVLQYNKRDLPDAVSMEQLDAALRIFETPRIGSCARNGEGVLETLRTSTEVLVRDLLRRFGNGVETEVEDAADLVAAVFHRFLDREEQVIKRAVPEWVRRYPRTGGDRPHRDDPIEVFGDLDAPPQREVDPPSDEEVQVLAPEDLLEESLQTQMRIAEDYNSLRQTQEDLTEVVEEKEQETREIFDQLLETESRHDDLLSTLGRDLEEPLSNLAATVDAIQRESDPDEARARLAEVQAESAELEGLVREILHARRTVTSGASMKEVLEMAREGCGERMERKGIDLQVEAEERLPLLAGDPSRIAFALRCVLSTAVQASPKGGKVRVRISFKEIRRDEDGRQTTRHFISVQVRDFSEGFPRDEWERLFAESPEGDASSLARSRAVLRRLGGLMQVKSKKGKGNLMTLYLPVAETASMPVATDRTA